MKLSLWYEVGSSILREMTKGGDDGMGKGEVYVGERRWFGLLIPSLATTLRFPFSPEEVINPLVPKPR